MQRHLALAVAQINICTGVEKDLGDLRLSYEVSRWILFIVYGSAFARREKEADALHEVRAELQIAEMGEGDRVFFDHDTKSVEMRVVITKEQLVSLAGVVQQDWKLTEEKSIFNFWRDGEVDRGRK